MFIKDLIFHVDTQCNAQLTVQVFINAKFDQRLQLRYQLNADLSQLRIPEPQAAKEVDGLWRHTCFELFVAVEGDVHYHEFNFSPSGQWAAYAFSDYRIAKTRAFNSNPIIHCSDNNKELVLDASISAADLPLNPNNKPFLLGLSAVLEDNNKGLSYWALRHPPGAPDFHHRIGFTCKTLL